MYMRPVMTGRGFNSTLEDLKYFYLFALVNEAKHGFKFRHAKCNVTETWRKVENGSV